MLLACGCPIISTPIPHALEVLSDDTGIIIDFNSSRQLSDTVNLLLCHDYKLQNMVSNGLHRMASTAWENSAIAHALLFEKNIIFPISLNYSIPDINFDHFNKLTTDFGIIQFSELNQPDIISGYTLDDNARALIAMCQYYELEGKSETLALIGTYLSFIKHCQIEDGRFLNYVDENGDFTEQNFETNLADSNGRAIWALGYLLSLSDILPVSVVEEASLIFWKAMPNLKDVYSTRAMAFIMKGLYYYDLFYNDYDCKELIIVMADRLVQMYRHEAGEDWSWFESYLTYGNSLLPEAMLCAWFATGHTEYRNIAKSSFDFLISKIFNDSSLKAISNKYWLIKGDENLMPAAGGEQPIEIAYTIMALDKFFGSFHSMEYLNLLRIAFSWFLGNNHLHRIVYNPCTGGCYDGLEEHSVNLNQGAESTLSYLIARLVIAKAIVVVKNNVIFINDTRVTTDYQDMHNV